MIQHRIVNFAKRVVTRLRSLFLTKWYGFNGKRIIFGKDVSIFNPQYISVGNGVNIENNVEFHIGTDIEGVVPSLIIKDRAKFGKYTCIGCSNKIVIGEDVRMAPYVHIADRNHSYEDIEKSVINQPTVSKGPVIICDQAWLGFGVQVMSGVTIGKHSIIAAGSVVTRDIPDYTVAAGNPAKPIRCYNFDTNSWERVVNTK